MELLLVVAAITGTVIGLAGRLPDPRKVKRELARARIQSIDTLVDGKPAAVRGTVALIDAGSFIVSPWTRESCVYYLITFDEVGVGGDYHELGRFDSGVPFLLRSDRGTARVVPDRPRIALPGKSFMRPMHAAHELLYIGRGHMKRPNWPTSWLRMTIYVLEPDTLVTLSGWCTREPDPEATDDVSGYREHLPTRPVISGTRRAKLLIG